MWKRSDFLSSSGVPRRLFRWTCFRPVCPLLRAISTGDTWVHHCGLHFLRGFPAGLLILGWTWVNVYPCGLTLATQTGIVWPTSTPGGVSPAKCPMRPSSAWNFTFPLGSAIRVTVTRSPRSCFGVGRDGGGAAAAVWRSASLLLRKCLGTRRLW